MLILQYTDFTTICSFLEHTDLEVNWCAGFDYDAQEYAQEPLVAYYHPGLRAHTALQAFTLRYEAASLRGLKCTFYKNAEKSTSINERQLTVADEIRTIWKKLVDMRVNFYQVDDRGINPLLWASHHSVNEVLPFLTQQYSEDQRLGEITLLPNADGSQCALYSLLTEFTLPSDHKGDTPHLKNWLKSITASHAEQFRAFFNSEKLSNIITLLICDSPALMPDFEATYRQCGIEISDEVWEKVLKSIATDPNLKLRQTTVNDKEILRTALENIFRKKKGLDPTQLIIDFFTNRGGNKYTLLNVVLQAFEVHCTPHALIQIFNQADEARNWNPLCYLINDVTLGRDDARYYTGQLPAIRAVWRIITDRSSAEARAHASNIMGINAAILNERKVPITEGGLTEPAAPAAPQAPAAPPAQAEPVIELNAQSTHSSIMHESTSKSEIVLRDRYKVKEMPLERKKAICAEIDAHYYSLNAFPLKNKTAYLENLKRSAENQTPIPGDTSGSIKSALRSRWAWIAARVEETAHFNLLETALKEYAQNHPEVKTQGTANFVQRVVKNYDWFTITYKTFRTHINSSRHKDPISQLTAEDVLLSIWLAINDTTYALSDATRSELKFRLGIAMVEIVHQYKVLQPTCASGTHNLLIDAVGKGDRIPGIYAFSAPAERLLSIQDLTAGFSLEAYFNTLSSSEKISWFQSSTAYDQALEACNKKLTEFIEHGANDQFKFFTQQEIQNFTRENSLSWADWKEKHRADQPTDAALITSALRGLSPSERSQVLSSTSNFSSFVRQAVPSLSDNTVDETMFQTIRQSMESTEDRIELCNYEKFFSESTDLVALITQHWNDYYCTLDSEKIRTLLGMLSLRPTGSDTHDKLLFARSDLQRLLDANKNSLQETDKATICEVYQTWFEVLEEQTLAELAEELEAIGNAAVETDRATATDGPALTPQHHATRRRRESSDSMDDKAEDREYQPKRPPTSPK
jgi:hypothetical protein